MHRGIRIGDSMQRQAMTSVTQLADRCQMALNDTAAGTWPQLHRVAQVTRAPTTRLFIN
jgi:hypothetical protein